MKEILLNVGEEHINLCECGKPLITRRTVEGIDLEHMGQTLHYMDILQSNFTNGHELLDEVLAFLTRCHTSNE